MLKKRLTKQRLACKTVHGIRYQMKSCSSQENKSKQRNFIKEKLYYYIHEGNCINYAYVYVYAYLYCIYTNYAYVFVYSYFMFYIYVRYEKLHEKV